MVGAARPRPCMGSHPLNRQTPLKTLSSATSLVGGNKSNGLLLP